MDIRLWHSKALAPKMFPARLCGRETRRPIHGKNDDAAGTGQLLLLEFRRLKPDLQTMGP